MVTKVVYSVQVIKVCLSSCDKINLYNFVKGRWGQVTKWRGAAAICINDQNELLKVVQEKPKQPELWSVPSDRKL